MALSIFHFCFSQGIALEAQWIQRSLNGKADLLCRFIDKDDSPINPSVSSPIKGFRVLTPSLLLLVVGVSMP